MVIITFDYILSIYEWKNFKLSVRHTSRKCCNFNVKSVNICQASDMSRHEHYCPGHTWVSWWSVKVQDKHLLFPRNIETRQREATFVSIQSLLSLVPISGTWNLLFWSPNPSCAKNQVKIHFYWCPIQRPLMVGLMIKCIFCILIQKLFGLDKWSRKSLGTQLFLL